MLSRPFFPSLADQDFSGAPQLARSAMCWILYGFGVILTVSKEYFSPATASSVSSGLQR